MANDNVLAGLAALVRAGRGITHEEIGKFPQNARTHHIRAVFVTAGVVPQHNEALAQLQLWVDRIVPTLPVQHQPVIRAYAEWHLVRSARLRAARRPFRPDADALNRQRIRCDIAFLSWLADEGASIGTPWASATSIPTSTPAPPNPESWAPSWPGCRHGA